MNTNTDGFGKLFFEKIWPVVTAALGSVASVSYTNARLNSPETISVHPVAITLSDKGQKITKDDRKKVIVQNCKVNLDQLEMTLKLKKPTDIKVLGYLNALVSSGRNSLSEARYLDDKDISKEDQLTFSFKSLKDNKVLEQCSDSLNATLMGVGAAVILSEKHDYLMSKKCQLHVFDRTSPWTPLELPVRISIDSQATASGQINEIIPLKTPTLSVSFTLDSRKGDAITGDKYFDFILDLQEKIKTGNALKASIICKVFFQDQVKHVGGDENDVDVLSENR